MRFTDTTGQEWDAEDYTAEVISLLRAALTESLTHIEPDDLEEVLGTPSEFAARMAKLVPCAVEPNPMADLVGPFYDTAGVRTLMGVSRQALHERSRRGTLLSMATSDDKTIYPTFQFLDAAVRPDLTGVLRAFRDQPRWSVGVWLRTTQSGLDGLSPEAWLRHGGDPAPVLRLAGRAVAQWAV